MEQNIKNIKVTVLMPVYNGEKFLRQAIESILAQTFKDFELLIMDDGSTDHSAEIISGYNDPRIVLVRSPKNLGLQKILNEGITLSKTNLIARMDCDDISLPSRLKIQMDFMQKNPDIAVAGTWVSLIDTNGNKTGAKWKYHTNPKEIRAQLLFHNYLAHPSIIFRKSMLPQDLFRPGFTPAEDYDLWVRTSKHNKITNIKKILLLYRVHGSNMSSIQIKKKEDAVNKIISDQLKNLDIVPTKDELNIHRKNYGFSGNDQLQFLDKREHWLRKLKKQNDSIKYYDQSSFDAVLAENWLTSTSSNARLGFITWKKFWGSLLSESIQISNKIGLLKFFIKCLIKK